MNIKIILDAIIGGILSAIKATRTYHRALKMIDRNQVDIYLNPYVEYIALHSPLTLYEANQVYTIAQAYGISEDHVIEYGFKMRGNVKAIVGKIEHS